MQLKKDRRESGASRFLFARPVALSQRALLIALLVAFCGGLLFQRSGSLAKLRTFLSHDLGNVAWNWVRSFGVETDRLTLDIKHKHWEKLSRWQQIADEQWQITPDLKQYVPADLTLNGKTVRADVRLKGEWGDHVDTDKWSLRARVKDGETLFGMRRFSIQHPKVRSYIYEWLHHAAMRREGVMALRYRFIDVTINGKDMGVYALEEHFAKQLIEANGRREGVILKYNADYRYKPVSSRQGSLWFDIQTGMVSQYAADLSFYEQDRILADPLLRDQAERAASMLEGLRARELSTPQVFAVEKLAIYIALSELMGTLETAGDWSDMRFYYDPLSLRLEPIAVEGALYQPRKNLLGAESRNAPERDDLHAILFSDDDFFRAYVAALEKVSAEDYVDALLAEVGEELEAQLRILHTEWPERTFSRHLLDQNAQALRDFLHPEKGLHAYFEALGALELGAIQAMPIEVIDVRGPDLVLLPAGEGPLILEGLAPDAPADYRKVSFRRSEGQLSREILSQLRVRYRILGHSELRETPVFPRPRRDPAFASDRLSQPLNAEQFDFLSFDAEQRLISIAPGNHRIDTNLVLPAGWRVRVPRGVQLDLRSGASILSYSALELTGTEAEEIVVTSKDESGGGLVVIDAAESSRLEHVLFRGLGTPSARGWGLTGAVTFYRSAVEIESCRFLDNRSEDCLNLVSSEFTISGSLFRDTPADAVDADFTRGRIVGTSFVDIGGDAIDVSGSSITVSELKLRGVGDKGLSVGEASRLEGQAIEIAEAKIGVAVKDLSSAELRALRITDTEIGLSAYQKKSEYGPGRIEVRELELTRTATPYLLEPGSRITVDGSDRPVNAESLKERF